jgi:LysM repeat protein
MLQRQWDQHPTPLSIATLTAKVNTNEAARMILATRIAAIGVMFAVFMFSAWQFTISQSSRSAHPLFTSIPAIPTPATSTELVSAMTQSQTCQETIYVVDDRDTLESIAAKFSVSKQDLLRANQIEGTAVQPGMSLVIPLCHFTPTANALTTTHTPVSSPITSTPGG